jgi:site-specific DNA recombinase
MRIVTKRRDTKQKKYQGAIPFTYGPLAYLLKNRVYIGEMHHGGMWYPGEQTPIIERSLFNRVQALLKTNSVERVAQRARSGALLMGKLFDDRGNVMSPSYSTKKCIRYRFYVSSALLRGRKAEAGSVGRVSATAIEEEITTFIANKFENETNNAESIRDLFARKIDRIELPQSCLRLSIRPNENAAEADRRSERVDIPWTKPVTSMPDVQADAIEQAPNPQLLNAIVRAHAWVKLLRDGVYATPEDLARGVKLHPNFVRHAIRAAFIDPSITKAVLQGRANETVLSRLRMDFGVGWIEQKDFFGVRAN